MKKIIPVVLSFAVLSLSGCSQALAAATAADLSSPVTSLTQVAETTPPIQSKTAYQDLIELYRDALTWSKDQLSMEELPLLLADCPGKVGYAVTDLDGDGTDELVIAAAEDVDACYAKMVFALYTLSENGSPVRIFSAGQRDRYYYAGGNHFANEGSSGADDSISTTFALDKGQWVNCHESCSPSDYRQLALQAF